MILENSKPINKGWFKKGKRANNGTPWNKGLTKYTDERVRKNAESISKSRLLGFKEGRIKIVKSHGNYPKTRPWTKKGKLHHNWKGDKCITPERERIRKTWESILWRKTIYIKDNFTCQKCGQYGGKLNAHHINNFANFPELRFAIDNGITLCKQHHNEFHRKYGRKNNTKEQLEEYLAKEVLISPESPEKFWESGFKLKPLHFQGFRKMIRLKTVR